MTTHCDDTFKEGFKLALNFLSVVSMRYGLESYNDIRIQALDLLENGGEPLAEFLNENFGGKIKVEKVW